MRYCTTYHMPPNIREKVNELRFTQSSLNQAIEYSAAHPSTRIIIDIAELDKTHISLLRDIQNENPQIYYNFINIAQMKEYIDFTNVPRHRYMSLFSASTWEMIDILLSLEVSDILIGPPLTFNAAETAKTLRKRDPNITIRINPVRGTPSLLPQSNGINDFWVLPQHVSLYEEYVDVLDLIDGNNSRCFALVEAYLNPSPFAAYVSTLVKNNRVNVSGNWFDKEFAEKRLSCRQICKQDPDKCHYCHNWLTLYKVFDKKSRN